MADGSAMGSVALAGSRTVARETGMAAGDRPCVDQCSDQLGYNLGPTVIDFADPRGVRATWLGVTTALAKTVTSSPPTLAPDPGALGSPRPERSPQALGTPLTPLPVSDGFVGQIRRSRTQIQRMVLAYPGRKFKAVTRPIDCFNVLGTTGFWF